MLIPEFTGVLHGRLSSVTELPRDFKPARGVEFASFSAKPQAQRVAGPSQTSSQRSGLRWEDTTHTMLRQAWERPGVNYFPGPWISFKDKSGMRVCQPDALLLTNSWLLIIEMKLTHTARAWWQLEKLYRPVCEKLVTCPIFTLEVCKQGDPMLSFPMPVRVYDKLANFAIPPRSHSNAFPILFLEH